MAKRNSTRRKARKAKALTVEGHLLTEALLADYKRCGLRLDDFLDHHRPSSKIKGHLAEIYHTGSRVSLAVGAMDKYPWYESNPASVRSAGCKLLTEMALELYNVSAKLTAIAMGVEAEKRTKLQDWLAQDEQIARIGRGAEVATHV